MKKFIFMLPILLMCSLVEAQCVAEVKDVLLDDARGSIIVQTEYKLNGVIVDVKANPDPSAIGQTRYLETTGTIQVPSGINSSWRSEILEYVEPRKMISDYSDSLDVFGDIDTLVKVK